jgi:transcriptional regulator with XRE-family HTH domain
MTLGLRSDTVRSSALVARLRRLRTAAGQGVEGLADAAGLSRTFYREIESGRADPGTLTYLDLLRLAEALDVPAAALLADFPGPPPRPVLPHPRRPE